MDLDDAKTSTAVVSELVDGDPREALKQFGSLFEQLRDIATQVIFTLQMNHSLTL